MSLTIELTPEVERQLRAEAARDGQSLEQWAQAQLETRLTATRERQVERNQAAIALLEEWQQEPPNPEEADGYPEQIERLRLREITLE